MEWLEELAATLGVPPLTDAEAEAILAVSREVAHGVERKATPLTLYLVGRAVQAREEATLTGVLGQVRAAV